MKPHISIITLGVNDLIKATAFYHQGLALPLSEHSNEHISFFNLKGTWLSLYPKDALAKDVGCEPSIANFSGMTLAHNVASKEDVRTVLQQAKTAGAKIIKSADDTFWGGYSGYFSDLDEHIWEVAYNPFFEID